MRKTGLVQVNAATVAAAGAAAASATAVDAADVSGAAAVSGVYVQLVVLCWSYAGGKHLFLYGMCRGVGRRRIARLPLLLLVSFCSFCFHLNSIWGAFDGSYGRSCTMQKMPLLSWIVCLFACLFVSLFACFPVVWCLSMCVCSVYSPRLAACMHGCCVMLLCCFLSTAILAAALSEAWNVSRPGALWRSVYFNS